MESAEILSRLPYGPGFLFVDGIDAVDEDGIRGHFTFDATLPFYAHHFKERPVTPGVILIECMAQIGLACFGMYLIGSGNSPKFAFSSSEVEFLKAVEPGERVVVSAEKIYFRFGKLKVEATLYDMQNQPVCRGTLSGMILTTP